MFPLNNPLIGVLAFQGSFSEHLIALKKAGIPACAVKTKSDLSKISGLIIPGGESTTIGHILKSFDLLLPLKEKIESKKLAVWGTCAGMILLAKKVLNKKPGQPILAVMDITVERNAFGRQIDSFEESLMVEIFGSKPFPAIFIRAPKIKKTAKNVEILAKCKNNTIVAARQNNLLTTAFHPELTCDLRFHKYFSKLASARN